MFVNQNRRNSNRREGPDLLLKFITWISIIGWALISSVLLIIARAEPESETFFDRLLQVQVRKTWDTELLHYAFILMIFLFIISGVGLYINSKRMRRKGDKYRLSLITMAIFSAVGMVVYLITF
jgi:hypothetical protein